MPCCSPTSSAPAQNDIAGRVCSTDYHIDDQAFFGEAEHVCDVLYVVGGLYGNPFALEAIDRLIADERARAAEAGTADIEIATVFNGDMHWFDKTAENFASIEKAAAKYTLLVGNVEAELRRDEPIGVGCGCAYPSCVDDATVARSNKIHSMLFEALASHPDLKDLMQGRPATTTVNVAGKKVGITHGDEKMVGGWACSREDLSELDRQRELDAFLEVNGVTVFATTHTCAAVAIELPHGVVINNGAAGLPNFAGQHFGLVIRIAETPHPDALFGAQRNGLFVEAVPLRYDQDSFVKWFDELWPEGSPAEISYRRRIVSGPADCVEEALLGGFQQLRR